MARQLFALGIALVFIAGFTGCGDKTDQTEVENAETLAQGLASMLSNIDTYSGYNGSSAGPGLLAPPGWSGPLEFSDIPEGEQTWYYFQKFATNCDDTPDTLLFLIMLTPDVWHDTIPYTEFVTTVDLWLWFMANDDVWWHFILEMDESDTAHISGSMKWHYESTWLSYVFADMGVVHEDESGVIDVTTSDDIKLSAHFEFIEDGSGTGWGRYQGYEFVRFIFYAEETPEGYIGYYTLASEGWKIEHPFPED